VKGRTIWGGLVPYGEVWRLGANNATTLTVTDPVKIAGHDVPAGSYGLFALPGKERWTLILSKRAVQWGAYFYKPEEDLLRFEVTPEPAPMTEWLTFTLLPASYGKTTVSFQWEKIHFSFPVEVDVDKVVWGQYDAALAETQGQDWGVLLTAANYALQREQRLEEARGWIDRSIALQESFWNYETKARLLKRDGKTAEALPLLDRAIELSRGKAPKGYTDGLEKTRQEWTSSPPASANFSGGSSPQSH
jgi:tetratricopeptide (TPR) repeat protein